MGSSTTVPPRPGRFGFGTVYAPTDFVVCWLLLTRPRPGLALAIAVMAVSVIVNWTCFPTFERGFNGVLVGLTAFGLLVFCTAPWLWRSIGRKSGE